MKKIASGLALLLVTSSLLSIPLSDRTFIAHRDELAYQAIEWTTSNHYRSEKNTKDMGGLLTATPFYGQSTNSSDLAYLFGMGTTGAINVTPISTITSLDNLEAELDATLYSVNIDHCPNCDGLSAGQLPMSGRLSIAPQRRTYGVYLGWDQSLDNILKGLRVRVIVPVVDVQTNLHSSDAGSQPSMVPATDGIPGSTLTDYFSGDFEKGPSRTSHVSQKKMLRGKISNTTESSLSIADIDIRLDWKCYSDERFSWTLGGSLQLPTGTTVSNEYLFEPIAGARMHVAAGLNTLLQLKAFNRKGVSVRVDVMGDVKYFFEGTERRIVSVYDRTDAVVMPGSPYRLVMHNIYSGVQPAANVMSLDHKVNPGFQFDGLIGVSSSWNQFTVDFGYNLYWHQEEKLALRNADTWADDQYAFAHNHYSMYADALGSFIVGGTSTLTGDTTVNHSSAAGRDSDYDDLNSPITKHQNKIGANRNNWASHSADIVVYSHMDDDGYYPGAFTSFSGPIQNDKKNTSTLLNQDVDTSTEGSIGVGIDGTGTQAVRYTITSDYAATAAQITHSLFGGLSYRITGEYPVIMGIGGMVELQESNRNSALEGMKVWAKIGVQF